MNIGIVFLSIQADCMCQRTIQAVIQMEIMIVFILIGYRCILIAGQAQIQSRTCVVSPLGQRLRIQHLAVVTTAIDLPYLGSVEQVDLGILRPGVFSETCTEDGCIGIFTRVLSILVSIYGSTDIYLSVKGTVGRVVSAKDSFHTSIGTAIVHLSLIDIARRHGIDTIGTTEDTV